METDNNELEEDSKKFQWKEVVMVLVAHLTHDVFTAFLAPVLPLLIDKFSLSYLSSSILNIVRKAPSLLSLFLGSLIKKIQNKYLQYLLIIAPLISSIFMSLLGVVPSYYWLVGVLLLVGTSSAVFHILSPIVIKEVSGKQLGKGISLYQLGGEAARTIGPLIILGAISIWGLEGSYRLIAIGIVVSIFLYWEIKDIEIKVVGNQSEHSIFNSISRIIKKRYHFILKLGGIKFFWNLAKISLTLFLPTYLKTVKGISLWFSGGALSILQFSGAVGTYLGGVISDKIGRKRTIFISVIVAGLTLELFSFSSGWVLLPFLIVSGFCLYAVNPIILAMVQEEGSSDLVEINDFYKSINFVSLAVATLIIGKVADVIGLDLIYHLIPIGLIFSIGVIMKLKDD